MFGGNGVILASWYTHGRVKRRSGNTMRGATKSLHPQYSY
jgi:hypothetical protein